MSYELFDQYFPEAKYLVMPEYLAGEPLTVPPWFPGWLFRHRAKAWFKRPLTCSNKL